MADATNATAATTEGQGQEVLSQDLHITRQLGLEIARNQLGNPGVLKATSGNAGKRLKIRQETRAATRAGKSAEAAIKQLAAQKIQAEKEKMQEWKEIVMQEVAQELQIIRQTYGEEFEKQRTFFVAEIETLKEEMKEMKERREGSKKQASGNKERNLVRVTKSSEEEEIQPQSQENVKVGQLVNY